MSCNGKEIGALTSTVSESRPHAHHLKSVAEPHWHIDYLLGYAEPVEVWYALSGRKREQDLAELLEQASGFRMPIHRFGSSDYRRSRTSHLFYSKHRPSFRWFQHQVSERFGADMAVEQYWIGPEQPASDPVSP